MESFQQKLDQLASTTSATSFSPLSHSSTSLFYEILHPVFVGGPSGVKKTQLLKNLSKTHHSVSLLNYESLTAVYRSNQKRIKAHLLDQRKDRKIYEHTKMCLDIHELIIRNYAAESITEQTVLKLLRECQELLEFNADKNIIIINISLEYFKQQIERLQIIYLEIIAFTSMLMNRHLFPSSKFIVIQDSSENVFLKCVGFYEKFQQFIYCADFILDRFDESQIQKIIMNLHKSIGNVEFELS